MGVPRTKKPKRKDNLYTLEEVTAILNLNKTGQYGFLADKYNMAQEQIQELDLFSVRMSLAIKDGDYDINTLREKSIKNGVDTEKVFQHTNKILNEVIMRERGRN